jgi:hypothetical protein
MLPSCERHRLAAERRKWVAGCFTIPKRRHAVLHFSNARRFVCSNGGEVYRLQGLPVAMGALGNTNRQAEGPGAGDRLRPSGQP